MDPAADATQRLRWSNTGPAGSSHPTIDPHTREVSTEGELLDRPRKKKNVRGEPPGAATMYETWRRSLRLRYSVFVHETSHVGPSFSPPAMPLCGGIPAALPEEIARRGNVRLSGSELCPVSHDLHFASGFLLRTAPEPSQAVVTGHVVRDSSTSCLWDGSVIG